MIERDPITTAKEVASIDHLSGGRFEFGVGAGWNREEMENHGTDPRRRMAIMAERVEAMKAIWTEDEASYHGEFVNFERIWSWPKPAQRPHPPVLVGGNGPTVLDRVLAFGDAWMPNYTGEDLLDRIEELCAARRPADRRDRDRRPPNPRCSRSCEGGRAGGSCATSPRRLWAGRSGARALGDGGRRTPRRVTRAE